MRNGLKPIVFLLRILASKPRIVFVCTPLIVMLTLVSVGTPFVSAWLVDALAYRQSSIAPFVWLSVLLVLGAAVTPVMQRIVSACSRDVESGLQFKVLGKLLEIHPSLLDNISDGGIVAKLTRDAYVVGGFIRSLYPRGLHAVVMVVVTGFILLMRSPLLGVAFVAIVPVVVALFIPYVRKFGDNSRRVRQRSDSAFNVLFGFMSVLTFLCALGSGHRFTEEPVSALRSLKAGNDESDSLSIRFSCLLNLILVCGEIPVVGIAVWFAARGAIPVGDVVLYQMLFISAVQAVQGVLGMLPEMTMLQESVGSLSELLDKKDRPVGRVRVERITDIEFQRVSFAYPNAPSRCVVNAFSADLPGTSVVGLSGSNGSGKSTLIKLAINALEPQSGEVLVNGHPFREIDLMEFRRRIGVVFQDNPIVPGSVRDNITLRETSYSQQDIQNALKVSGFDAVVNRLPQGLDTHIEMGSAGLSGGERQRLAIARAIIRNPLVLILDEATNHLDVESRKCLLNMIDHVRNSRLVIIAGHDEELNALCDMTIQCETLSTPDSILNNGRVPVEVKQQKERENE